MKKVILFLLSVLLPAMAAAQMVIPPRTATKTSFAIVVDRASYDKVRGAIEAYRDVIEADGLGAYIIYDDWQSPTPIREKLIELYNDKKSPIEGAALLGDIPIAMIRDGQHLTSAFKMDQRRNWQQSSIASDRYYDDFGLKFDYIKQDSLKPLYHYYSLRADSRQVLSRTIYSGRIMPLREGNGDKYEQLEKYLLKVVAERRANAGNVVDNLTMARGHGYNSESKVAWSGEQVVLKEQFPELHKTGGKVRYMDFETRFPAKPLYLNEVLRPELDIMLFHHHGSYYYQFLNGYKNGSDQNTSKENLKLYIRSKVLSAYESGKSKEEAIQHYMDYLDVPRAWCEEAFDPAMIEKDSLFNLTLDINVGDVLAISPNARFVMFDACYNGSYYRDEYIAGAYIFNDGKTIVTQANTVNTIQDKWPDEFLGLLAGGMRVGQWGKYTQFLETHIIGDPTFRFANNALDFDINEAVVRHARDVKFWLKKVSHPSVDVQAMAYNMLYLNGYPGLSDMLYKAYFSSESGIVRMEAMKLLQKIDDANYIRVLQAAVDDSYELVRRFAMEWMGKNGSDELIPAFVRSLLTDNSSERVYFKYGQYVKLFNSDKMAEEIRRQMSEMVFYDASVGDKAIAELGRLSAAEQRNLAVITDSSAADKDRRSEIQSFRNHPLSRAAEVLLAFAADPVNSTELRVAVLETLGWYTMSFRRTEIIAGLEKISAAGGDAAVTNEATKSIKRLKDR
ncbi:HEAT repeat domain-containing protein [Alistipes sp. OttesenSCG-928-B03]|nr:HEAT repeat domain-containing protein [Alistipes sp. OttesenSCG-928-B03]